MPLDILAGNGRGLSTDLWDGFDTTDILVYRNENVGYGIKPNLASIDVAVDADAPTVLYASDGARGYADSGVVIEQSNVHRGGVVRYQTGATQFNEGWLQWCGTGGPFIISDTVAENREMVFEVAFKPLATVWSQMAFFIGLAGNDLAQADMITDAGVMADKSFVGFHLNGTTGMDFVYRKLGQALQTPGSTWQVLTDDTWYHVGIRFDTATDSITPWFGTGDRTTSAMGSDKTSQITSADIAAATFPDGVGLAPLIGVKTLAAAGIILDVRLLACAQLAPAAD